MKNLKLVAETFGRGKGILELIPNFVPRRLSRSGKRLRLHPDDYYILEIAQGALKENWFSSIIPAMNGENQQVKSIIEYYLDEYTFWFNRRTSKSRGLLFYRLIQNAVEIDPITYWKIVNE